MSQPPTSLSETDLKRLVYAFSEHIRTGDRLERHHLSQCHKAVQELLRLRKLEVSARALLATVADKSEPWNSPHNKALTDLGDIISVNEGNLWGLHAAVGELDAHG